MQKILFVIPDFGVGGTNTSLLSILNALKNRCDFSIFVISEQGELKAKFWGTNLVRPNKFLSLWYGNYKVMDTKDKILATMLKIGKKITYSLNIDIESFILKYISKDKRFSGFDTVVGFQEGNATRFGAFIPAERHICWIHCNLKYSNINRKLYIDSYDRYDEIVCVSQSCKHAFDEIYSDFRYKSSVIYNLINRDRIITLSRTYDDDFANISDGRFTIISVGRIHPIKQFCKIPEVAAKIKTNTIRFKWIIIGEGEEAEKQNIMNEIQKWGVENEVIMAGFKDNPYPLFAKADLYACTSLSEACPMVFLESNVFGLPVVSNDFPSAHELLTEDTGTICTLDQMPEVICRYIVNHYKISVPDLGIQQNSLKNLTSLFVEK